MTEMFVIVISVLVVAHSGRYAAAQSNLLLSMLYEQTNGYNESIPDVDNFLDAYDFIVIGSGSGGSVMANRLSEEPGYTVLLLEAGAEENFLSDVPLTPAATQISKFNWGYKTEREPGSCLGLAGGVCNWPKGRALGGTSVINFMLYQRGHRRDFDNWAANGNTGWSYAEVLPYFKKSERVGIPEMRTSPYHGQFGYLDVQRARFKTQVLDTFLESANEFGYAVNDPNGESLLGFSHAQATLRRGRRCSAAKAFLRPIIHRPNLHISMNTRVTRILIDPKLKMAYGVEFVKHRQVFRVRARREVILSAGSIGSPQLLMLSGIGPREDLEKFKIPVIQDLRVGYNLQDHSVMNGLDFVVDAPITVSESNAQNPFHILDYVMRGSGPFTLPGGAEGLAFIKVNGSSYPPDYPDIELVIGAGGVSGDLSGTMRNMIGMTEQFYQKVYKGIRGRPAFGMVPVLLRPNSRGRISLKSKNPFHWPRMQPHFFTNQSDITTLIKGIRKCIDLTKTKAFARWNTRLNTRPFPGCEHFKFGSDSYWECCIRRYAGSLQHQAGTCKMGPESDPTAVVNPQLQVIGVRRLRVVDASIMPEIVAGHTNAATFMIGEKAADMVKDYWRNSIER